MKYQAKPVIVDALRIVSVGPRDEHGAARVALENGQNERADKGMLARFMPAAGDFWVTQADGYVYLNPKDVFERKYSRCELDALELGAALRRPPFETFKHPTCRGSLVFGSACGHCERCSWEQQTSGYAAGVQPIK